MNNFYEQKTNYPPGWKVSTLDDSCEILLGQSPPSSTYNTLKIGLPFFQGKTEFGSVSPTPAKWCSKPIKISLPKDILISVRAPVGPTNICIEKCCIGRGLAVIRAKEELNYKFLFYYLRYIENSWSEKATGTTFKAISGNTIRKQLIPLPALDEQIRIVEYIEKLFTQLDAGMVGLKRVQAALKRYRASVLKAACEGRFSHNHVSKNTSLPTGWKIIRLGELTTHVTSGSRGWAKYYSNDGDLFLRVGNFNRLSTSIDLTNLVYVNAPSTPEENRTRLQKSDILVTITADVGMIGLVEDNISQYWDKAYINQHVALVRLSNPNFAPYIAYALASEMCQTQFEKKQYGATKKGLNLEDLRSINIPLPPFSEQVLITHEIEQRLSLANEIEQTIITNLHRARKLRDSVLKQAFEGRI